MVTSDIGKGSTFTILLPIIETQASHSGEESSEELPRGTERILLVDDEEAITQALQFLLKGLGYKVRAFSRSTSAWEDFSADPDASDIVVTDYTMPLMTGIALSEKIRELRPDVPIILCSGYLALKERLDDLQPIEFLKKPVTARELAHTLRRVLERSGK
jgi:DNA-binding NtrC family response regulator